MFSCPLPDVLSYETNELVAAYLTYYDRDLNWSGLYSIQFLSGQLTFNLLIIEPYQIKIVTTLKRFELLYFLSILYLARY